MVKKIRKCKPLLDKMVDKGKLEAVGAFYDLDTGKVEPMEGNLRQKKLPVISNDELCELSQSLNELLELMKKTRSSSRPPAE